MYEYILKRKRLKSGGVNLILLKCLKVREKVSKAITYILFLKRHKVQVQVQVQVYFQHMYTYLPY